MKPFLKLSVGCLLALLLTGCAGRGQAPAMADEYLQALDRFPAHGLQPEQAVAKFEAVFHNLGSEGLEAHVNLAYAENLFFNDTLHTLEDRQKLLDYLSRTGERLQDMQVSVLGWSQQGDDLFVRWLMQTDFRLAGRDRRVRTVGMTHLRFNEAGKIVLHQDFWDSSQGLYEHVPILGGMIRWIRAQL